MATFKEIYFNLDSNQWRNFSYKRILKTGEME